MTEEEYQEIKILLDRGVSLRQAAGNPARKLQFLRLRKKKGEHRRVVAAVIREAAQAANSPPTTTPATPATPATSATSDTQADIPISRVNNELPRGEVIEDEPVPETREMLDMAKRVLYHQLKRGYFSPACLKLCFQLCEKEIPEWTAVHTKAVKDQYESILESVVKKSSGFKILERKETNGNDNTGNAGNPSPR